MSEYLQPCPTEKQLREFITGTLADSYWEDVEQHIAQCAACIQRLDEMEICNDNYVAKLVQANHDKSNAEKRLPCLSDSPPTPTGDHQPGVTAALNEQSLPKSDLLQLTVPGEFPSASGYKVTKYLGGGGMGHVYLAEQQEPVRREVALKIIRAESPTDEILTRFEAERQALAIMNHPNIAMIFDAGSTDDRRPFFAMELVTGVPITEYCDTQRLTIPDRLKLFIPICRAIQHAHQKGIIHRDIKPSNILVTATDGLATVKIIDFGLAKAVSKDSKLTDQTLHTKFGLVVGTPEYMSPEQAGLHGLDVDTRSDVYSLGVLLYELLVGATPFEDARRSASSLDEVLSLIRHTDPPFPSSYLKDSREDLERVSLARQVSVAKLSVLLRRDLDWITFRALEKDRSRRYDGVAALVEDIERYLRSEPVKARSPTLGYVIRKAYRKHKARFLAIATIFAFLIFALWGTGVMWLVTYRAEQVASQALKNEKKANEEIQKQRNDLRDALARVQLERENANRNLTTARQSVDKFFSTISENHLLNVPEMHALRSELLREGVGYYDQFVIENAKDPSLRAELAAAHFRVAQCTFTPEPASLMRTLEEFSQGIVILEELLEAPKGSVAWGSMENGVYKGRMRFPPGQRPEIPKWQAIMIRPFALRACEAWRQLSEQLPDRPGVESDLAGMYNILALIEHSAGQLDNAIASYSSSISIWESLVDGERADENYLSEIAIGCSNLAKVRCDMFRQDGERRNLLVAVDLQTRAVELSKNIVSNFDRNPPPSFVVDFSALSRDLSGYLILCAEIESARHVLETASQVLKEHSKQSAFDEELAALDLQFSKIRLPAEWPFGNSSDAGGK